MTEQSHLRRDELKLVSLSLVDEYTVSARFVANDGSQHDMDCTIEPFELNGRVLTNVTRFDPDFLTADVIDNSRGLIDAVVAFWKGTRLPKH